MDHPMDHPMDLVHGLTHGPDPGTTPNFLKEIAPVNMKIYQRLGYEKHNTDLLLMSLMVCLVLAGCFGVAPPYIEVHNVHHKRNKMTPLVLLP